MLNVIAKHGECRLSAGISKSCYHAVKILRDGNSYDVEIIREYEFQVELIKNKLLGKHLHNLKKLSLYMSILNPKKNTS